MGQVTMVNKEASGGSNLFRKGMAYATGLHGIMSGKYGDMPLKARKEVASFLSSGSRKSNLDLKQYGVIKKLPRELRMALAQTNRLESFSATLSSLDELSGIEITKLKNLDLGNFYATQTDKKTTISELPTDLNLPNLKFLSLCDTNVGEFPRELNLKLTKLESIIMTGTPFSEMRGKDRQLQQERTQANPPISSCTVQTED